MCFHDGNDGIIKSHVVDRRVVWRSANIIYLYNVTMIDERNNESKQILLSVNK